MSEALPQEQQFLSLVRPWLDLYDQAAISASGVWKGEQAQILVSRIIFAPMLPDATSPMPLDDPIFWAQSEVRKFSGETRELLIQGLLKGSIEFDGFSASLPNEDERPPHANFFPGSHPDFGANQSAQRLPTLFISGRSRHQVLAEAINLAEIEWHLRAMNPPFSDLTDLHGYYGLPTPSQWGGDSTRIEIIVRPPVEMDSRSVIQGQKARIWIRALNSIQTSKVVVGYRGWASNAGLLRGQIPSETLSWTENGSILDGYAEIDVGDSPSIQCFLAYDTAAVQQWWVVDPLRHLNARHALHCAFDADMVGLRKLLLENKRTEARAFEDAIAILFGMLGFSVTQNGRSSRLSEGPDVVAITPGGSVAIVECTVGLPDQGDQIAKVVQRTEAARRVLASAGWPGVRVLPMVVTPLPEAEIQIHKADAERNGVAVMYLEMIQEALQRVRLPVDADRLFNETADRLLQISQMAAAAGQ